MRTWSLYQIYVVHFTRIVRVCPNGGVDAWEDSCGGAARTEGAEAWEE